MIIDIEQSGPTPIYEQIMNQVIYGIVAGARAPGELMLSVRQQAEKLGINPNTVARAYEKLEEMGVLAARRGLGMEVTEQAPALCRDRRKELIRDRVRAALREAVASALDPEQIRKLVDEELARANGHKRREKP